MIDDVGVTVHTAMAPFRGTSAASHEDENMTSNTFHVANIDEIEPRPNEGEHVQLCDERRLKRKQFLEAQVTTGCGGGRKKQRIVDAFYETLWPMLEDSGWEIVKGKGKDDGAVYFLPPGLSLEETSKHSKDFGPNKKKVYNKSDSASEGEWKCTKCGHSNTERSRCKMCLGWKGGLRIQKAYFNKMRDVIERVLKSSDEIEVKAAQAYMKVVPDIYDQFFPQDTGSTSPNRRVGTRQRHVDIDWKHERKHYPKATSRVGEDYQVIEIPALCSSFESKEKNGYDQIWDWNKAASKGKLEFVDTRVSPNKKVEAYEKLHQRGYVLPGFFREVCDIPVTNGSDWTDDDRKRFKVSIFKELKNISRVSESIGKPMKECLAYYYGTFKQTKDYQKLKATIQRHKQKSTSAGLSGLWVCDTCGVGGTLIACDSCEAHYHLTCLIPPLCEVPEGSWVCSKCEKPENDPAGVKFEAACSSESCSTNQSEGDHKANANDSSVLKGLLLTVDSIQPAVESLGSISRPMSVQAREDHAVHMQEYEIDQRTGNAANNGRVGDDTFCGDISSAHASGPS